MARFLLVHGAYHDAWCGNEVLPLLSREGHSATAIDLPCHGDDRTAIREASLGAYVDAIIAALEEPVVLVGHSMAGYPIAVVAERVPELVHRIVYVAAYAPRTGMSAMAMRAEIPGYMVDSAIALTPDGMATTIDPAVGSTLLYHDCPPAAVEYALPRLRPEPTTPLQMAVELTARYAGVSKSYIRCTEDRVTLPEYQRAMTSMWPSGSVSDLRCGHSPFFAQPAALGRPDRRCGSANGSMTSP